MNPNKRFVLLAAWACAVAAPLHAQNPVFIPSGEPIEVAPSSFGNKAIRMAMNGAGEPVIAFGTNGHLYVTKWDGAAGGFGEPVEIDADENVFMSDAEGPRMASQGNYIVLTYQLSGQWATGARSVHSTDGGVTWSEPVAMAPNASVDHFMPCVGIDDAGNPFAGVKVGNNPATIYEGILRSEDAGMTWLDAVNASAPADGEAVCECCPSQPFWAEGRYYDLVRNNNNNVRDFWLMSSVDGIAWYGALDVDPLDWMISSCPESGPAVTGPVGDGTYLVAFMSAAGASGQSRVHVSHVDLWANDGIGAWELTEPVTVSQFDNATQNVPVLAQWNGGDEPLVALAWEQNTAGYDVQLALSQGENVSLTDVAQNLTDGWSGQHRRPVIGFSTGDAEEPILHVAWQHSASGTVHYMTGTVGEPSIVICFAQPEPQVVAEPNGIRIHLTEGWSNARWSVWDITGRLVASGIYDGYESVWVGNSALPPHAIVSVESPNGARWAQPIKR
jgi:hypothetical protein